MDDESLIHDDADEEEEEEEPLASYVQLPITDFFSKAEPKAIRGGVARAPAPAGPLPRPAWRQWVNVESRRAGGGGGAQLEGFVASALGHLATLPIAFPSPRDGAGARVAASEVCAMEWDPQGVLLAVGSADGLVRIYDHDELCLQNALLRNACNRGSRVALTANPAASLVRAAAAARCTASSEKGRKRGVLGHETRL